jgi:hypothetical protein
MSALRFGSCMIALAVVLAGCSLHPLPETSPLNFPRASTFDIVQKVRCEAKAGLDRFKDRRNQEQITQIINATSIGYDFKFVMSEHNDLNAGGLDFVGKPNNKSSKGSRTLGFTGSARRGRDNTRTFRIIEELADVDKLECSPATLRANLAYPISGSLRVDDVVYTYIALERMSNLDELVGRNDSDIAEENKRAGVFSEHLEYQTNLELGATPTLKISAVAGRFRLTNATVTGHVSRNDTHDVIIAFAQDPDFHSHEVQRAARQRSEFLRARPAGAVEKKIVRTPRLETGLAQANSRARTRVMLELARVRHLKDDEQESSKFLGQRLLTFLRPPDEHGADDSP